MGMQITTKSEIGTIRTAKSDDGRIEYLPIGNDRLIIDGRDARRGVYTVAGRASDEEVEETLWQAACELMRAVDSHNQEVLDNARDAAEAKEIEEAELLQKTLANTRGTYADKNTY